MQEVFRKRNKSPNLTFFPNKQHKILPIYYRDIKCCLLFFSTRLWSWLEHTCKKVKRKWLNKNRPFRKEDRKSLKSVHKDITFSNLSPSAYLLNHRWEHKHPPTDTILCFTYQHSVCRVSLTVSSYWLTIAMVYLGQITCPSQSKWQQTAMNTLKLNGILEFPVNPQIRFVGCGKKLCYPEGVTGRCSNFLLESRFSDPSRKLCPYNMLSNSWNHCAPEKSKLSNKPNRDFDTAECRMWWKLSNLDFDQSNWYF